MKKKIMKHFGICCVKMSIKRLIKMSSKVTFTYSALYRLFQNRFIVITGILCGIVDFEINF